MVVEWWWWIGWLAMMVIVLYVYAVLSIFEVLGIRY